MWTTRKEQIEPQGKWLIWLLLAGRGFGKTRTGAETIRMWIEQNRYKTIGFIGYSELEVRKIMVEGTSGILTLSENSYKQPKYESSKRLISYEDGTKIHLFSGESPDQLRGFELDVVWIDEFAKFKDHEELWNQVMMTLRNSSNPKIICTTTPKPIPILRKWLEDKSVHVTRGSTYDNAENLSPIFLSYIKGYYEKTNFEKQEIYGEIIDENNDLFSKSVIERTKINNKPPDTFDSIVLGVDPAVSNGKHSDESGIVLVGMRRNIFYLLKDASGKYTPTEWANQIVDIYKKYKCTVAIETNNGGDFLANTVRTICSSVKIVNKRAVSSKVERAYTISVLYNQGRIKHIKEFSAIENQMLNYKSCKSPDRIDALIWAIDELKNKCRKFNYNNVILY